MYGFNVSTAYTVKLRLIGPLRQITYQTDKRHLLIHLYSNMITARLE